MKYMHLDMFSFVKKNLCIWRITPFCLRIYQNDGSSQTARVIGGCLNIGVVINEPNKQTEISSHDPQLKRI